MHARTVVVVVVDFNYHLKTVIVLALMFQNTVQWIKRGAKHHSLLSISVLHN